MAKKGDPTFRKYTPAELKARREDPVIGERIRQQQQRYRDRNKAKVQARRKVQHALATGKLTRQPCEQCGSTEQVWATHKDYDNPLDIAWICSICYYATNPNESRIDTD